MLGFMKDGFFKKNYLVMFGQAGQKMLGPLEHKIPPQVRQDYDGLHQISDKNLLANMTIAIQLDITSHIT